MTSLKHFNLKASAEKFWKCPTEEFKNLDGHADKIKYCYQRLKANNKVFDQEICSGKNESLAIEARGKGNDLKKDKDFVRALEYYNKSICLSPSDSENIGICYANRSAIYFESGLYKLSLENIDLAFTHQYPEKWTHKLEDRQKKCFEKLSSDKQEIYNKESHSLKLSYQANKDIPSIVEGLEYAESKEFGRYLRAKRNLYPGDIVMIDKAYIKYVDEGSEYVKCNNCLQSNFLHLFPCPHCTKAMYCGSTCAQMAWKRFHMYECQVDERYVNTFVTRATLFSFTLFDDCAKLKDVIDSIKKKPVTCFDWKCKNVSEEETFKVIYSLATNSSKRSYDDMFTRSNFLAQTWHILITNTKIRDLLRTTADEDFFLETLFHFSLLKSTNAHELRHMSQPPKDKIEQEGDYSSEKFGAGLFPIISLLNHSCAPNVSRIYINDTIAITVTRNIRSGEQLFDSYGFDHTDHTIEERRTKISNYHFECRCEACRNNWPLREGLKEKGILEIGEVAVGFKDCCKYNREWAVEYFDKSKKFLKKFSQNYCPSIEVCAAQNLLNESRNILYGNTPLEFQLTPR